MAPSVLSRVATCRRALLRDGPAALDLEQLLTVVLGAPPADTTLLDLTERFDGLRGLAVRSPRELQTVRGLSAAAAVHLAACAELGRRAVLEPPPERRSVSSSHDIAACFRFAHILEHECLWVVALDGRHRMLRTVLVSQGGPSICHVRAADIFGPVLRERATAAIVVHNHPSGDPEPSHQDRVLTRALARGADVLGLRFLDHIVVAARGHVSLRARGALEDEADRHWRPTPPNRDSKSRSEARVAAPTRSSM